MFQDAAHPPSYVDQILERDRRLSRLDRRKEIRSAVERRGSDQLEAGLRSDGDDRLSRNPVPADATTAHGDEARSHAAAQG